MRGLSRPKFSEHLEWIRLSLAEPQLKRRSDEDRAQHPVRLRKHEAEQQAKGRIAIRRWFRKASTLLRLHIYPSAHPPTIVVPGIAGYRELDQVAL